MRHRAPIPALLLVASVLSSSARAEELSPEVVAKIEHEQEKALAEVDKRYEGKKSSELDAAQRRERIREEAQARQAALDKLGVDSKAYARYSARMGRDEVAQSKSARQKLSEQETRNEEEKKQAEEAKKAHAEAEEQEKARRRAAAEERMLQQFPQMPRFRRR